MARFSQLLRCLSWRNASRPTTLTRHQGGQLRLQEDEWMRLWHMCTPAGTGELRAGIALASNSWHPPTQPQAHRRDVLPQLWTRCETVHEAAAPHSCQNPWLPTNAVLLLSVHVIRQ